jgi:RNA polymerase sigma factor (sigma-70 family)
MPSWGPMFDELMESRYRELLAYASMLTGSRAEAEDLLHDALIETFSKNRTFTHVVAAETFVRRTIASRFIDRARRRTVERRVFSKLGVGRSSADAGPELLAEHATDVERALAHLTPRERVCVTLRFIDGLTVAETAGVLDLAEGSVKRYVSDALHKLNGILGDVVTVDDDGPSIAATVREF